MRRETNMQRTGSGIEWIGGYDFDAEGLQYFLYVLLPFKVRKGQTQHAGTGRKTDFGSQTKFQQNILVRYQNYQKMQKLKKFMEGPFLLYKMVG